MGPLSRLITSTVTASFVGISHIFPNEGWRCVTSATPIPSHKIPAHA